MDAGNFNYEDNTTTRNESTTGSLLPSIPSGTMPCSTGDFYSQLGAADDNITKENELADFLHDDDSMAGNSEKKVDYPSRNEQETSSLVDTSVEIKNDDSVENQTLQNTHSEMEDTKKELVFQKKLTNYDFTCTNGLRAQGKHFVEVKPVIPLPATLTLTDHQVGREFDMMKFKINGRQDIFLIKESWLRYQGSQGLKEGDTIKIERIMKLKEGEQKTENIDWEELDKLDRVHTEYTITKIPAEDQVHNED